MAHRIDAGRAGPRAPGANANRSVVIVGGGIAGIACSVVLAERGIDVTLCERGHSLGGRAGAVETILSDGSRAQVEVGFHAFFRQYYNLRALLSRIDPALSMLTPLHDYLIMGRGGERESFAGLPARPPMNLLALVARTPTITLREMIRFEGRVLWEMLGFDAERSYRTLDHMSARSFLDILGFPARARRMLFDVFSHSFFNPEATMSAAEMVMMFHFYFMGNPEGLLFDVVNRPLSTAVWEPFEQWLRNKRVDIRFGTTVERVERVESRDEQPSKRFRITLEDGAILTSDGVVLATEVPALKTIVQHSVTLGDSAWRDDVQALDVTWPYAVWRLWLDRDCQSDRLPFVGTAGVGLLDNISLYHRFEDESRQWHERTGGSVVELHAYGVDPSREESAVREELLAGLHEIYPETRDANIVDSRFAMRRDCPSFGLGSHARRPGVSTPTERLLLAGDYVRIAAPTALMERAATTGMLAANGLLESWGCASEPVRGIPARGIVAPLLHFRPWNTQKALDRLAERGPDHPGV